MSETIRVPLQTLEEALGQRWPGCELLACAQTLGPWCWSVLLRVREEGIYHGLVDLRYPEPRFEWVVEDDDARALGTFFAHANACLGGDGK